MSDTPDIQRSEIPTKNVNGETVEEKLTENAHDRILPARYLIKDENGDVQETPQEMFERVAKNVAQPDKEYEHTDYEESWKEFYDLMTGLKFMPNSPTLMNAGADLQQLSACFVAHPQDDMDSIFDTVHDAAKIFQSGGGMGYPFHLMRPKGDQVSSTGGIASGPMTFQQVFDTMCGTIKQGGKRRGAQMGIMKIDHPDVLRFIVSKRKEGNLSNFNISVGLTEDFMDAVKNDEEYELINPRTEEVHEVTTETAQFYNKDEEWYPEAAGSDQGKDDNFWRDFAHTFGDEVQEFDIDLQPGEKMTLPARFIWETLVDGAWRNGEPGLFMYDETNDMHSFDTEKHPEHRVEATNPCGEQPLENYEACNLGHINLSLLVKDDAPTYKQYREHNGAGVRSYVHEALDLDELERIARIGTRFLDNVVTMSDFPLQEIEDTVSSMRKIGLGLMGFAQMLVQMGVVYGSDDSIEVAEEIQRLITKMSVRASHDLAEERGEFSEWENSKWADPTEYAEWFKQYTGGLNPEDFEDGLKLRNHNTTTIAPTGTTSMIGNTSGGCEPIYNLAYFKNVAKDIQGEDMLVEFDDYFLKVIEASDADVEEVKADAQQKMENNEWEGIESISDDVLRPSLKELFITADKVGPEEHIDIQAAFQKHNHSGISKTCNFPNSATKDDVREAYMRAYDKGVKGMTVYRDGTRDTQVMQTNKENKKTEKKDVVEWFEEAEEAEIAEVMDTFTDESVEEQVPESSEEEVVVQEQEASSVERNAEAMAEDAPPTEQSRGVVEERPDSVSGTTQEIETAYGDLYVTVNDAEGNGPFEVFARVGKSGGYTQSFTEAIGRLTSLALRSGASSEEVINQLDGIRSPQVSWDNGQQVHSIPDAVATAMKRHEGASVKSPQSTLKESAASSAESGGGDAGVKSVVSTGQSPECPECGDMVEMQEGCKKCSSCGWSKC